MIAQKQKTIIGLIVGSIAGIVAYIVVEYILYLLWGGKKINLGAAVVSGIVVAFIIYKKDKLHFFKKNRR